jgi:hypothetical protein
MSQKDQMVDAFRISLKYFSIDVDFLIVHKEERIFHLWSHALNAL